MCNVYSGQVPGLQYPDVELGDTPVSRREQFAVKDAGARKRKDKGEPEVAAGAVQEPPKRSKATGDLPSKDTAEHQLKRTRRHLQDDDSEDDGKRARGSKEPTRKGTAICLPNAKAKAASALVTSSEVEQNNVNTEAGCSSEPTPDCWRTGGHEVEIEPKAVPKAKSTAKATAKAKAKARSNKSEEQEPEVEVEAEPKAKAKAKARSKKSEDQEPDLEVEAEPKAKAKAKARSKKSEDQEPDMEVEAEPKAKAKAKARGKKSEDQEQDMQVEAEPKAKAKAKGKRGPKGKRLVPEDDPSLCEGSGSNADLGDPADDAFRGHVEQEILECFRACKASPEFGQKGKHTHTEPEIDLRDDLQLSVYWSRNAVGIKHRGRNAGAQFCYFSRESVCSCSNLILMKYWAGSSGVSAQSFFYKGDNYTLLFSVLDRVLCCWHSRMVAAAQVKKFRVQAAAGEDAQKALDRMKLMLGTCHSQALARFKLELQ